MIGVRPDFLACLALRCPICGTQVYHAQTLTIVRLIATNHWKGDDPLRIEELLGAVSVLTEKPWTIKEVEYACKDALRSRLIIETADGRFCMDDSQLELYLNTAGKCSKCGNFVYELQDLHNRN